MKKHNGMRPHDVVILLKIATKGTDSWTMKDLAYEAKISASEVSESFNRSIYAGLLSSDKKQLMRSALLEFLEHGLKYVYPQQPGALVKGIATAYSADPLVKDIQSSEQVVWPFAEGDIRGQAIEPLHPNVPAACLEDKKLYELLALADALRIGRKREKQMAMEELKKRL
jgi:predicted transcriptional regulator